MVRGKACNPSGLRGTHRKPGEPALRDCRHQGVRIGGQLANADLDGDFPGGSGGNEHLVARLGLEEAAPGDRPQEDMRIEQEPHYRPSNPASTLSGSGASKSGAILTLPFRTPNLMWRFCGTSAVIRTSGFPLRLTTTSSPD